jgi:hypothetical protein
MLAALVGAQPLRDTFETPTHIPWASLAESTWLGIAKAVASRAVIDSLLLAHSWQSASHQVRCFGSGVWLG